MTRARFLLGDESLRARFDEVRRAVITARRDPDDLRAEIVAMRDKVRAAHPVKAGRFDVKHSPGGMVDVEFAVQFLVLSQSANTRCAGGQSSATSRCCNARRRPACCRTASAPRRRSAYRELRRVQHHARLNETATQLPKRPARARARGRAGTVAGGVRTANGLTGQQARRQGPDQAGN